MKNERGLIIVAVIAWVFIAGVVGFFAGHKMNVHLDKQDAIGSDH